MSKEQDLIKAAFDSAALASGGLLQPEQSDRFIDKLIEASTILKEARLIRMNRDKMLVEELGFGSTVLQVASEGTAPGSTTAPSTRKVELSTVELIAAVDVTKDSIEQNIEKEKLTEHIISLLSERIAIDLEDLAINGDTDGAGLYAALDGYLKQAVSNVESTATSFDKTEAEAMLDLLPAKYLRVPANWRFYVSPKQLRNYKSSLSSKDTSLGDLVITSNAVADINALGIPVKQVHLLGNADALLVQPQNLLYGISRQISIDTEWKPRKRVYEITATVKVDFKYENEDAVVKADALT